MLDLNLLYMMLSNPKCLLYRSSWDCIKEKIKACLVSVFENGY